MEGAAGSGKRMGNLGVRGLLRQAWYRTDNLPERSIRAGRTPVADSTLDVGRTGAGMKADDGCGTEALRDEWHSSGQGGIR